MSFISSVVLHKKLKRFVAIYDIFWLRASLFVIKGPLGILLRLGHKITSKFSVVSSGVVFFSKRRLSNTILKVLRLVFGLASGFFVDFRINGVGYKMQAYRYNTYYELGHSHYILYKFLKGMFGGHKKYRGVIFGNLCQSLYSSAREIKNLSYPDSYKGKGFRYSFETLRLKIGKQRQR